MKKFPCLLVLCAMLAFVVPARAGQKVLASVHPLGLVAASVTPLDDLTVLVPIGMTPHDFSLRPSDVERIKSADIVFWAGAEAEPYLAGFVRRWPDKIWIDVAPSADGAAEHGHEEHGNEPVHQDEHEDGHHHDPHWWLAADVMITAQQRLAAALHRDAGDFARTVEQQLQVSRQQLSPLSGRGFFVFHQAYDHWVSDMGLNQMGAFTLSPEQKPGLKTLQRMRQQLAQGDVVCVFSEPEFSPALIDSVVRGLDVQRGELDPMAANIPLSEDGYVRYLQDLTQRFSACLSADE